MCRILFVATMLAATSATSFADNTNNNAIMGGNTVPPNSPILDCVHVAFPQCTNG
jgi:hypothetical protein